MSVVTPKFRASFPTVFEPRVNDFNGQEEYSIVALFPKDADLTKLKEAARQAIAKKWGDDPAKHPKNLRTPFRDQAEMEKEGKLPDGCEDGAIFMRFKTKQKPGVVDENVQPLLDASQFYAGCYARASVNAYAYDTKGNKGVAFGLTNVQKMGDGDPLGSKKSPDQDFTAVEGATTSSDATGLFD